MRIFALILSLLLLVSCGGGSGSGASGQSITVVGKVMDGYIENATVCLDLNKNYMCDDGEPYTTTDASGGYALVFNGSAVNQIILAQVFGESKDADDGGKTLNEAGRNGFTLAAPASQASVISPLTTMVTLELLTNINSSITDAAIAAAVKNVQTALHNADPIMGSDYIKSGNANLHQLAAVIAAALPEASMMADTGVRGIASKTITDPAVIQQTVYKATRDAIYESLAFVIDFNSSNALKYSQVNAQSNVMIAIDFMGITGAGAATTLVFMMPDRESYLNNTTFHDSRCPSNLSDAECFARQEFVIQ